MWKQTVYGPTVPLTFEKGLNGTTTTLVFNIVGNPQVYSKGFNLGLQSKMASVKGRDGRSFLLGDDLEPEVPTPRYGDGGEDTGEVF